MPAPRRGGNRQPELFARGKRPAITLPVPQIRHWLRTAAQAGDWHHATALVERALSEGMRRL